MLKERRRFWRSNSLKLSPIPIPSILININIVLLQIWSLAIHFNAKLFSIYPHHQVFNNPYKEWLANFDLTIWIYITNY
jgi:hypothetical protein